MEKVTEQIMSDVEVKNLRDALIDEGAKCEYCGCPMECFDHALPRSRGGANILSNLVRCCLSCNSEKRDKNLPEYVAYLKTKRVEKGARMDVKIQLMTFLEYFKEFEYKFKNAQLSDVTKSFECLVKFYEAVERAEAMD